jgi:peptide chain release factor 2
MSLQKNKIRLSEIISEFLRAFEQLKITEKENYLSKLISESKMPNYWDNPLKAQDTEKAISKITNTIDPWLRMKKDLDDIMNLIGFGDESIDEELSKSIDELESRFNAMKKDLLFSGPYDDHDVVMSIYAGAGGTDAQDWAQMLFRMYSRWAESKKFKITILDQSDGEEAGIKTVTFSIIGLNAYGLLKGESGVHRLVRLSPFNSDNLRQTSFAKVQVTPEIENENEIIIDEKTLKIDVYRAGGHGGQSVNTTDSAVRITHIPTGLTVAIQNERSQLQNKETAMKLLKSQLLQLQIEQHQSKIDDLRGPNLSAEWGNQIRNYVLHPYKQVKDTRTKYESSNPDEVLSGAIDPFIQSYQSYSLNIDD